MAANQRHKSSSRKSVARPNGATNSKSQARRIVDETSDEVSGDLSRGASQVQAVTRDHEGTAVLVALAAGFGVGILLGAAMASSHSQPRGWRDRVTAEGLGRRLRERVEGMIPDVVSEYVRR